MINNQHTHLPVLNNQQMINNQQMMNNPIIMNNQPIMNNPPVMNNLQMMNNPPIMNNQQFLKDSQIIINQQTMYRHVLENDVILNNESMINDQPILNNEQNQQMIKNQHTNQQSPNLNQSPSVNITNLSSSGPCGYCALMLCSKCVDSSAYCHGHENGRTVCANDSRINRIISLDSNRVLLCFDDVCRKKVRFNLSKNDYQLFASYYSEFDVFFLL